MAWGRSSTVQRGIRVVVGLAFALLLALAIEGASSAWWGHSLLRGALEPSAGLTSALLDSERRAAAAATAGPLQLSLDPYVGFLVKPSLRHAFLGVDATTDDTGMRVRPAGPPSPGQRRVAVLGDSVAFGMGVADHETYAAQLEGLLDRMLPSGAARPAVLTIACPGWNAENEARWLVAHLDRVAPDLVLWLLINNDLCDGGVVTEAGQRAMVVDPVGGAAHPHVSTEQHVALFVGLGPRTPLPRIARIITAGGRRAVEHAIKTGVTPESVRRWAKLVDDARALREALARRDARLVVVMDYDEDFQRLAALDLLEAMPDLDVVCLLRERRREHGIGDDPHPNPRTIAAGARRLAAFLNQRVALAERAGLGGASAEALPPLEPAFADQEVAAPSREDLRAWAGTYRAMIASFLEPAIDVDDGTGYHQVYGGMEPDGTVGRALWCTLKVQGAQAIALRVRPIDGAASLYPLELAGSFRGASVESAPARAVLARADGDAEVVVEVPIPESLRGGECLDVLVQAQSWIEEVAAGRSRLAAFRLRRIEAR